MPPATAEQIGQHLHTVPVGIDHLAGLQQHEAQTGLQNIPAVESVGFQAPVAEAHPPGCAHCHTEHHMHEAHDVANAMFAKVETVQAHAPPTPDHHEHTHEAHVHGPNCGHHMHEADHHGSELFASAAQQYEYRDRHDDQGHHKHEHTPGHVCSASCEHHQSHVKGLSDTLFANTQHNDHHEHTHEAHVHGPNCGHHMHEADAHSDALFGEKAHRVADITPPAETKKHQYPEVTASVVSKETVANQTLVSQQQQAAEQSQVAAVAAPQVEHKSIIETPGPSVAQEQELQAVTIAVQVMAAEKAVGSVSSERLAEEPVAKSADEALVLRLTETAVVERPESLRPDTQEAAQLTFAEITESEPSALPVLDEAEVYPEEQAEFVVAGDEVAEISLPSLENLADSIAMASVEETTEVLPVASEGAVQAELPALVAIEQQPVLEVASMGLEPAPAEVTLAAEVAKTASTHPLPALETSAVLVPLAETTIVKTAPVLEKKPALTHAIAEVIVSAPIEIRAEASHLLAEVESLVATVEVNPLEAELYVPVMQEKIIMLSRLLDLEPSELFALLEIEPKGLTVAASTLELLGALQQLMHDEYRKEFFVITNHATQQVRDNPSVWEYLGSSIIRLVNHLEQLMSFAPARA